MRRLLRIAALYNMGWGSWAVFAPGYPEFWQAIGLSAAILGAGTQRSGTELFAEELPQELGEILALFFAEAGSDCADD